MDGARGAGRGLAVHGEGAGPPGCGRRGMGISSLEIPGSEKPVRRAPFGQGGISSLTLSWGAGPGLAVRLPSPARPPGPEDAPSLHAASAGSELDPSPALRRCRGLSGAGPATRSFAARRPAGRHSRAARIWASVFSAQGHRGTPAVIARRPRALAHQPCRPRRFLSLVRRNLRRPRNRRRSPDGPDPGPSRTRGFPGPRR